MKKSMKTEGVYAVKLSDTSVTSSSEYKDLGPLKVSKSCKKQT